MKSQQQNNENKKNTYKSPLEGQYYRAMKRIRGRRLETREEEVELAHSINKIEKYGFEFFPNMQIYDEVKHVCRVADEVDPKPQKVNKAS